MAHTQLDLIKDALAELGVVAIGGPVAAQDYEFTSRRFVTKTAEWRENGYVWWDLDAIPDEVFPTLSLLLQNEVANAYSRSLPPQEKQAVEDQLIRRLMRLRSARASGESAHVIFF